jgi:hypothetical protein
MIIAAIAIQEEKKPANLDGADGDGQVSLFFATHQVSH